MCKCERPLICLTLGQILLTFLAVCRRRRCGGERRWETRRPPGKNQYLPSLYDARRRDSGYESESVATFCPKGRASLPPQTVEGAEQRQGQYCVSAGLTAGSHWTISISATMRVLRLHSKSITMNSSSGSQLVESQEHHRLQP